MFTGLIQSVGELTAIQTRGNYRVLTIKPDTLFDQVTLGESIACDGSSGVAIAQECDDRFTRRGMYGTIYT